MESESTETDITCPTYGEVRTNWKETDDDKKVALQSEVNTIWGELDLIREECTRDRKRCMESSLVQTISERTGEMREVNRSGRRGRGREGRGRDSECICKDKYWQLYRYSYCPRFTRENVACYLV